MHTPSPRPFLGRAHCFICRPDSAVSHDSEAERGCVWAFLSKMMFVVVLKQDFLVAKSSIEMLSKEAIIQ